MRDKEPGEGKAFGGVAEIPHALDNGIVTLHSKIKAVMSASDRMGSRTPGLRDDARPHAAAEVLPKSPASASIWRTSF